jgi:hypothetical protein
MGCRLGSDGKAANTCMRPTNREADMKLRPRSHWAAMRNAAFMCRLLDSLTVGEARLGIQPICGTCLARSSGTNPSVDAS